MLIQTCGDKEGQSLNSFEYTTSEVLHFASLFHPILVANIIGLGSVAQTVQ